ncbi:MAG: tetratricopeptide repeat protein [Lewinellaceae bacterium]|nr:tetratricopeptide repeat protein [Lewinellaceae bacterium]
MAKRATKNGSSSQTSKHQDKHISPGGWMPWIPVALAVLVFATGLTNNILGVDDHTATLNNPAVKNFELFGSFNLGMYAPVTWAGYAIAYTLGGESPFLYHLLSLVVHALNVWLVYHLLLRLSGRAQVAFGVALIFAIHPVQVESVAWIAGFSTPLFALFYLLACDRYLHYRDAPSRTDQYWLALLFFVLACLAKSAAVTLPLTLLVLDWWRKPQMDRSRQILGYLPFFGVALGFGLLTIYSREQAMLALEYNSTPLSLTERALVLGYTPVFYWIKILLPTSFNIYYSFDKINGQLPWTYTVAPVLLAVVLFLAWRSREKAPWAWRGLVFYFTTIVVMLPFRSLGTFEMCADHYNYLPIIGFALLLVEGWYWLRERYPGINGFLQFAGFAWCIALVLLSFMQVRVWKDTITVVTNAINNGYTQNGMMYSARGKEWGSQGNIQAAIQDFSKALEINPNLTEAYKYRGGLFGVGKQYDRSLDDFNKFLEQVPDDPEILYNRALTCINLQRYPEALADLNRTIELAPDFIRAYRARSNVRQILGDTTGGAADLQEYGRRGGQ